jgi:hypothetical protein
LLLLAGGDKSTQKKNIFKGNFGGKELPGVDSHA